MESNKLDWSLYPQQHQTSSDNQPIIIKYQHNTLATIKPNNLGELILEAAMEFNLVPDSFHLAVLINQRHFKISHSLYQRIAPLSTIHVQLDIPHSSSTLESQTQPLFIEQQQPPSTEQQQPPSTEQQQQLLTKQQQPLLTQQQQPLLTEQHLKSTNSSPIPIITHPLPTHPNSIVSSSSSSSSSSKSIHTSNPRKKFLINSLVSHQSNSNNTKFPFLSKRNSISSSSSTSSSKNININSNADIEESNRTKKKKKMMMMMMMMNSSSHNVLNTCSTTSACSVTDKEDAHVHNTVDDAVVKMIP